MQVVSCTCAFSFLLNSVSYWGSHFLLWKHHSSYLLAHLAGCPHHGQWSLAHCGFPWVISHLASCHCQGRQSLAHHGLPWSPTLWSPTLSVALAMPSSLWCTGFTQPPIPRGLMPLLVAFAMLGGLGHTVVSHGLPPFPGIMWSPVACGLRPCQLPVALAMLGCLWHTVVSHRAHLASCPHHGQQSLAHHGLPQSPALRTQAR